ncbi:leucyl/phenylalanyl-tRNA--protein transferase [Bermanella sp. WJH001]|uniref:leucyl/phenylalanyl-tRNA--protein transferase n=1 Tax=Bermanella sp. WJH001 TaxID=3048005 RepID=UPI0024BDBFAB|nr:leucyl/phenylalanyl-tRNA--protein transferase [Bermanella sp. WJH001]MDJ1537011.1 leucyl/phenylalanyl-tRNA--protein transferase [Bermanella sp. WJH001]
MSQPIQWLNDDPRLFPRHEYALKEPNGLLAAGGDLSCERLLNAYSLGIFPWYSEDDPILWWSPDPRCVLIPDEFKPSRSLSKAIRKSGYKVTSNKCFKEVVTECAAPRLKQDGTWINTHIIESYSNLHKLGYAHSVECWDENELIGGLYGIAIGRAFFGESMFSKKSNSSKIAFAFLCKKLSDWGFEIIDCQVHNPHLESLGAIEIPRAEFLKKLNVAIRLEPKEEWNFG